MRPATFAFFLALIWLILPMPVLAQTAQPNAGAGITSPGKGDALQGVVTIQGSTGGDGFQSAEVAFAYADNPTNTWFRLAEITSPVKSGTLATWDTTTMTDGEYVLRLVVTRQDGATQTFTVGGLRVRNYTPVETRVPTHTATSAVVAHSTPAPPSPTSPPPTATLVPDTPTALPVNPARVARQAVGISLGQGALTAVAIFVGLGMYLGLKALWRRF